MQRSRFSIVLCVLLAGVLAGGAKGQSIRSLWADQCIRCHGDRGQGGMTESLLREGGILTDGSDKAFFDVIKDGLPEHGMPGYAEALSDAEIWGLVVYLRELQHRDRRANGAAPKRDADGTFKTQHHDFVIEPAFNGRLDVPWSVAWLPDGRMLITERPGGVRLVDADGSSVTLRGTPEVFARGQGGMMEVAVHPEYASNGWIYLAYSDPQGRVSMTKVVRGKIEGDQWTAQETVFQAPARTYVPTAIHFGCRLVFAGEYLFISIGERGMGEHAPLLDRPNGKVHRVHHDGSIPSDNPFVGREGALGSIWSYGHRNPQGMVLDLGGNLWVTEHGPRGGDELNLVKKGANYGWPSYSFGMNYNGTAYRTPWPAEDAGLTQPVFVWLPSIAACGLDVVDEGKAFPAWKGDLLAGGLAGETVERLRVRDGKVVEREELVFGEGRVRDVRVGPDGLVYVVLNGPDAIVRLRPVASE